MKKNSVFHWKYKKNHRIDEHDSKIIYEECEMDVIASLRGNLTCVIASLRGNLMCVIASLRGNLMCVIASLRGNLLKKINNNVILLIETFQ